MRESTRHGTKKTNWAEPRGLRELIKIVVEIQEKPRLHEFE